jgi:DnaJ-domain-containing protein 1
MELDHDTGIMDGEVLAGPLRGKKLSQLQQAELQKLHAQCRAANDQSLPLFEAWLDRTQSEWRANWGGKQKTTAAAGSMSREEAYAVLGLKPGASPEDVKSAHKRLMKEFHPDRGGSDYLAAKINMAKDVLLAA